MVRQRERGVAQGQGLSGKQVQGGSCPALPPRLLPLLPLAACPPKARQRPAGGSTPSKPDQATTLGAHPPPRLQDARSRACHMRPDSGSGTVLPTHAPPLAHSPAVATRTQSSAAAAREELAVGAMTHRRGRRTRGCTGCGWGSVFWVVKEAGG